MFSHCCISSLPFTRSKLWIWKVINIQKRAVAKKPKEQINFAYCSLTGQIHNIIRKMDRVAFAF